MDKSIRITIYGQLKGKLWMPPHQCAKDFQLELERVPADRTVTYPGISPTRMQFHKLRDVYLHLTNDGDFQDCQIVWAQVDIVYTSYPGSFSKRRKVGTFNLTGQLDGNKDCFEQE